MRMNCDAFVLRAATAPGAGVDSLSVDELNWIRPVRPGDRLHVRRTVVSARPVGAEEGEPALLFELVSQEGTVATSQQSTLALLRREMRAR